MWPSCTPFPRHVVTGGAMSFSSKAMVCPKGRTRKAPWMTAPPAGHRSSDAQHEPPSALRLCARRRSLIETARPEGHRRNIRGEDRDFPAPREARPQRCGRPGGDRPAPVHGHHVELRDLPGGRRFEHAHQDETRHIAVGADDARRALESRLAEPFPITGTWDG